MVLGIPAGEYFLDTQGLYALLSLIPLILLYLIKPKPKEKTIPSLMFIVRDMGAAERRSFFQRFAKDWLFWIQLLTLLVLSLAVAKPYTEVSSEQLASHTVIVIDASASMQTEMNGETRFEKARDRALEEIGDSNTIIVAKDRPLVSKKRADRKEAKAFLEGLNPSDTETAIYDSARSALEYANEDTHIIVLSDFLETKVDNDINTVKRALKAKGAIVEMVPFVNEVGNVGITRLDVKERETSVQIKNYFKEKKEFGIEVGNIEDSMELEPGASDIFTFSTPKGANTLKLDVDDSLPVDNKAFISTPERKELSVAIITNNQNIKKTNFWVALQAINQRTTYDLKTRIATPPTSVSVEDHDVVVLKDFSTEKILPGIFQDLQEAIKENGVSLIITPQKNLFNYGPLKPLLPVTNNGTSTQSSVVERASQADRLTNEVDFGTADYYFKTKAKEGVRPIAKTENDNSSIIAMEERGAGNIIYYGVFDEDVQAEGETKKSTFKNDLYYPIFWKRALDVFTGIPSIQSLNRKTGSVMELPEGRQVKTPEGETVTGAFLLDKQGIYSFSKQDIAANLLNEEESDVSGTFTEQEVEEVESEMVTKKRPKQLTNYFIIAGLLLLLLELLYTKYRGDM